MIDKRESERVPFHYDKKEILINIFPRKVPLFEIPLVLHGILPVITSDCNKNFLFLSH